jgi:hypothetical protein
MKHLYILGFLLFINTLLSGQYIDNRLDIYAGGGISIPVSSKNTGQGSFVYPSLLGNFAESACYKAGLNYWLKSNICLGFEYEKVKFSQWQGNEEIFVIISPKLRLNSFSLQAGYFPDVLKQIKIPGKIGILGGVELVQQSLSWTAFSYTFYHPNITTLPFEDTNISQGFKVGLRYTKQLNFNGGIQFDLSYKFYQAESLYYVEKSFQSLNFSVLLSFRALKNRHYNYV